MTGLMNSSKMMTCIVMARGYLMFREERGRIQRFVLTTSKDINFPYFYSARHDFGECNLDAFFKSLMKR